MERRSRLKEIGRAEKRAIAPFLEDAALVPGSSFEVAQVLRCHFCDLRARGLLLEHTGKVVNYLVSCRTPALGGTLYACEQCGEEMAVYRSCRDRHCPKCSALDSARWERARTERALPVPYLHTVVTIPGRLRPLYKKNQRLLYGRLLALAGETVLGLAEDRLGDGARSGATAVLHTWNREGAYHPHVHLLVLSGGLSTDGRWLERKQDALLPLDQLRARWKAAILGDLRDLLDSGSLDLGGAGVDEVRRTLDSLETIDWIVYAKRTLSGADEAIGYLARYTSKVALANNRILDFDGATVLLATKNGESVRLGSLEFCERFISHILPKGFVRIRHYGILSSRNVPTLLARARAALANGPQVEPAAGAKLGWQDLLLDLNGTDVKKCRSCGGPRVAFDLRPRETVERALARQVGRREA